jgi:small nuclear ribonucleoprotein (snRNP)-like protein
MLHRNCFLKHVIERKIEGRDRSDGKTGRRCKQVLDKFKEKRVYLKLKKDTLERTVRRSRFGR